MAQTVKEERAAEERPTEDGLCLCEQYVRVTEGAALVAARWLGRADQEGAERDAAAAMRAVLDDFPIAGKVVIGSADDDSPLRVGEVIVRPQDRGRPPSARLDRPPEAHWRNRQRDRRGVRTTPERHHDDRPRPATAPRSDRGHSRLGRAHQADPGRHRDGIDLGCDPRNERPPRRRDRRHAPGGYVGGGPALSRR